MVKKALLGVAGIVVAVTATAAFLYLTNGTPIVRPISEVQAAAGRPYIIKLHAQWCPICMVTKGVWSQIERAYADKANLIVWDFTDEKTTAASRTDAARLGLGDAFEEYQGATGLMIVVDSRSGKVAGEVGGVESFATYRSAIDQLLAGHVVGE
jgi:hypothetical protein